MRIDLLHSVHRPWFIKMGLSLMQWRVGALPGPPLAISYKPKFFQRDFISYIIRAMAGSGGWNKGEAELFASFVSKLNQCEF